jgi:hypothetical protein
MLERLKTSDAMACKFGVSLPNCKVESEIQICPAISNLLCENQNSNLVLPNGIDLANEVLDLRDLTERYWRVIQAQHVRIARLESELCARTARR